MEFTGLGLWEPSAFHEITIHVDESLKSALMELHEEHTCDVSLKRTPMELYEWHEINLGAMYVGINKRLSNALLQS